MNRERLEKIGIAATLLSVAIGLYLYKKQESANAAAAAASASPDLADAYGDQSLFSQPTVLPAGDSTQNSGAGITLPGVPDYGNTGDTTPPGDTSPSQPTQVASSVPAPSLRTGGYVTNSHTMPVSQTSSVPVTTAAPVVQQPVYTAGNSHTQPISGSATRVANFHIAHPNAVNASY